MGGRRYFRHPELQHHKDEPWVFLDKEGYYVDLDSSIDPSGGARRGHGNKSWGECKRGARDTIMVGLVKDLEKERKDEWQARFDANMAKIEAYNAETQKINEEWSRMFLEDIQAKRQSLKTVSAAATRAQKPPASVDSHFKRPKPPASKKKKEREAGRAKIQALRAKRQSQGLKVSGPLAQEGQRKIPPEKLGSPDPPSAAAAASVAASASAWMGSPDPPAAAAAASAADMDRKPAARAPKPSGAVSHLYKQPKKANTAHRPNMHKFDPNDPFSRTAAYSGTPPPSLASGKPPAAAPGLKPPAAVAAASAAAMTRKPMARAQEPPSIAGLFADHRPAQLGGLIELNNKANLLMAAYYERQNIDPNNSFPNATGQAPGSRILAPRQPTASKLCDENAGEGEKISAQPSPLGRTDVVSPPPARTVAKGHPDPLGAAMTATATPSIPMGSGPHSQSPGLKAPSGDLAKSGSMDAVMAQLKSKFKPSADPAIEEQVDHATKKVDAITTLQNGQAESAAKSAPSNQPSPSTAHGSPGNVPSEGSLLKDPLSKLPKDIAKHLDVDLEKSLKSQTQAEDADDGPPLNQDPAYAKYFKMLKMGLPMGAVKNAMQLDGRDPSIMDLDRDKSVASQLQDKKKDGPPSPSGLAPARATPPRATKKMQTVHVNTVEKEKLPNSLWASGGNADHDIDTEILESLFSEKEKVAAAKSKKIVTLTSLIDSKRAKHIEVSLKSSQFRAFANNFDALCQAVVSLDEQHLNAEKLTIMQSSMLPEQEDLESLQQFSGQHDELGPADRWVLAVTKVPRFPQKLSAFKYSLQFDELIQSLTSSLNLLASACDEVTQNDDLANLLRRLLTIVNTMNKGTRKESFESITLGSLIPIAKKKGGDRKTTLLDILVSSVPIEWPGLPAVNAAMKLDLGELRPLLREIQTGALGIERSIEAEKSDDGSSLYLQKLELFLQNTTGERNDVNALFELVEKKVATLCDYFGEDSKTCKTSTVFGTLLEFSRLVEKSIAALAQKKN